MFTFPSEKVNSKISCYEANRALGRAALDKHFCWVNQGLCGRLALPVGAGWNTAKWQKCHPLKIYNAHTN
jgi:hypothetical protein